MGLTTHNSFIDTLIAGGVGGSCLIIVGHPLDTIKVRLQVNRSSCNTLRGMPVYTGMVDCVRKTIAKEGVNGLFKGISAPLPVATPVYALCFVGYECGKRIFTTDKSYEDLDILAIAAAGSMSGVFSSPLQTPQERIKCVMQVETTSKYRNSFACGKALYAEGGLRSLFCGFNATFLRYTFASAIYFSSYEYFKKKLAKENGSHSPLRTLTAGGLAGLCNFFSVPLDVVKSKIQSSSYQNYPKGFRGVCMEIMRVEGIRGFYRGLGPTMLRSFPANAACFLGYEYTLTLLRQIRGSA